GDRAADVEMRAVDDPVVDRATVFAQALLHVDAFGLVARKGEVEPVQAAVLQRLLPFELVEKLRTCMAGAEQQPVATAGTGRDALLHEAAERCDTSAGADHQEVAAAVD